MMRQSNANLKNYKSTTPGFRHRIVLNYKKLLSNDEPHKPLLVALKKHAGRNQQGRITVRHRGGGAKAIYRIIDFKRDKLGVTGIVKTIEYDPNRNSFISLIAYLDGEKRYILTPHNLKVADRIISDVRTDIKIGNAAELKNIPDGTLIHNIELRPGQGGLLVRSAGTSAQVLGKDDQQKYTIIKLASGEIRKVLSNCYATIGEVGNKNFNLISIGKAGINRHLGKRPTVRGSAMNAVDHPHGGGEGKAPIGRKQPLTFTGKKFFGIKTRQKKRFSDRLIVTSRHRNKKR